MGAGGEKSRFRQGAFAGGNQGNRENIPEEMEIESFVHGAMCISYSGRCLLSNYFTGRDANQGECTHPCRWKYAVMEESRPGEYLPVYENERGTFIFNSRDLCMIEHIPELMEAGIDSFKIEGRMKTALYVATVAVPIGRPLTIICVRRRNTGITCRGTGTKSPNVPTGSLLPDSISANLRSRRRFMTITLMSVNIFIWVLSALSGKTDLPESSSVTSSVPGTK